MAIYAPGQKFRRHRLLSKGNAKRSLVVALSLTAMVDMFTVLVIFLLQNYNQTGQIIEIPKGVMLPKAEVVKELEPSVVVSITPTAIMIDNEEVADIKQIRATSDWMIPSLAERAMFYLKQAKMKYESALPVAVQRALRTNQREQNQAGQEVKDPWNRITVQADRALDFLTLKKVMYTLSESGVREINFAVLREEQKAM
jgi:biopolymer transport protein ExbD